MVDSGDRLGEVPVEFNCNRAELVSAKRAAGLARWSYCFASEPPLLFVSLLDRFALFSAFDEHEDEEAGEASGMNTECGQPLFVGVSAPL